MSHTSFKMNRGWQMELFTVRKSENRNWKSISDFLETPTWSNLCRDTILLPVSISYPNQLQRVKEPFTHSSLQWLSHLCPCSCTPHSYIYTREPASSLHLTFNEISFECNLLPSLKRHYKTNCNSPSLDILSTGASNEVNDVMDWQHLYFSNIKSISSLSLLFSI